jgi:hypothetical protein
MDGYRNPLAAAHFELRHNSETSVVRSSSCEKTTSKICDVMNLLTWDQVSKRSKWQLEYALFFAQATSEIGSETD